MNLTLRFNITLLWLKKKLAFALLVLTLVSLASVAQAQGPTGGTNGQLIRLRVATFDPIAGGDPFADNQLGAQTVQAAGPYYLVQFNGPIEAVWVRQIEQLGAKVLGYVPDQAHIVRIQPEDVAKIESLPSVRWVGPYRAEYKLAPELTQQVQAAGDKIEVYVVAFPGESRTDLETFLKSQGAEISDIAETEIGLTFRINVPAAALVGIARRPAINWIEPYQPFIPFNDQARKVINVESTWQSNGLFGAGQIVAVSDTGLSVQGNLNADFAGRLLQAFPPSEMNLQAGPVCADVTTWTDLHGHGTHVAGSVLGNGQNSGSDPANHDYLSSFAGSAPEANLVFMALSGTGGGLECISTNGSFLAKGYEAGARISSHSWGNNTNSYGLLSSIVDNFVWQNKDYLVLYAAGNSGPGSNTVGQPATAKNILAVGASENNRPEAGTNSDDPDTMAFFSSRGPTADGRFKPDIVTPGTNVISVRGVQTPLTPFPGNNAYTTLSGTSMATPLTAGASAIVREWLAKERNVTNPSAALMRGLMIHGAHQLPGATTPNNTSGWGRTDVKNTINGQYVVFDDHLQGLSTGQTRTYSVTVIANTPAGTLVTGAGTTPGPTAVDTLHLQSTDPPATNIAALSQPTGLNLRPLPGFDTAAQNEAPIQSGPTEDKSALTPLTGLTSPLFLGHESPATVRPVGADEVEPNSFLINLVGGGDFEDPGWTDTWSGVWLGAGVPLRTSASAISGNYSMWLGGTAIDDSVWYPLDFPDTIASDFPSKLQFKVKMTDLDPSFDYFCYAFTDVSGVPIGFDPECTDDGFGDGVIVSVERTLLANEKATLAGKTGYLVFYNVTDHALPHMSAFVDDIVLDLDFADPTLTSIPSAGPPGSVFLLSGSNNTPYGPVEVCETACPGGSLGTIYADAQGDLAAYLETTMATSPGLLTIETSDINTRTVTTDINITSGNAPTLSVSPTIGQAGTRFQLSGTDFLPDDTGIAVTINNNFAGTVASNAAGAVAFAVQTSSNTPPGSYTVEATDSGNRSAMVSFEVTTISGGNPSMTVAPTAGPPGTTFAFTGQNFTANTTVDFSLDGQAVGQMTANGSGGFVLNLNTNETIAPGTYVLQATQPNKQASAQFLITDGAGGGEPSGSGLYVTLVWTDPPAQASAAAPLINNLNLRVEGPGGPYLGNGGNSPDTLNTVETVRLETPDPGEYTIIVEANSVNATFGTQPYALLVTTAQNYGGNSSNIEFSNEVYLPIILSQ